MLTPAEKRLKEKVDAREKRLNKKTCEIFGRRFGKFSKSIMKKEMPKDFLNALKEFSKTEDDILDYYTKYHNENDFVSCGSNTKAAFFNKAKKNVFLKMEVKNALIISDFADGIKIRGYAKDELLLLRERKFEIKNVEKIDDKYLITLIEK